MLTDFALGFYSALTILGLLVFAIMYAHEGRRMSKLEGIFSLTAILCWPLLALAIALVTFIARARKSLVKRNDT